MHLFAGLWQTKPKKDGTCERFPLGTVPPKGSASSNVIKKVRSLCTKYPEYCKPQGLTPTNISGLILFGYPLAHATQDRSAIFSSIKPSTAPPILFISGDKDEMSRGLESAIAKCDGTTTKIVRIPGAGHECWHPYRKQAHEMMHSEIERFIHDQ